MSRYAATPLIVALSPDYSDITRFRPWSPVATVNNLDHAEKNFKIYSDDWHRWSFSSTFRHFGPHFADSFRMSKSSWMMDSTSSREMPSSSAIDLAEIRRSSKISSWIWSIISGVVPVLSRPRRGTFWPPSFWRWHTMVHVSLMFLAEWCEFPSAPYLAEKKLYDSSRLDVVEIARVAWHASFHPL